MKNDVPSKYHNDLISNHILSDLVSKIQSDAYYQLVAQELQLKSSYTVTGVDAIKMFINGYIAAAMKTLIPQHKERHVLLIDAPYLLSSLTFKHFIDQPEKTIHIPNGYRHGSKWISDAPEMQQWAKRSNTHFNIYENDSQQFLINISIDKSILSYGLFYLDYCGCYQSRKHNPMTGMRDMDMILQVMPNDLPFLIGITSARRGSCVKNVTEVMCQSIIDTCKIYGHSVHVLTLFNYRRKSNMVFECFAINVKKNLVNKWTKECRTPFPKNVEMTNSQGILYTPF
jgi:hypothetical protein